MSDVWIGHGDGLDLPSLAKEWLAWNNPPNKSAGFGWEASRAGAGSSEKPNDPPNKSAGFEWDERRVRVVLRE
jgi:hypothetical protein